MEKETIILIIMGILVISIFVYMYEQQKITCSKTPKELYQEYKDFEWVDATLEMCGKSKRIN